MPEITDPRTVAIKLEEKKSWFRCPNCEVKISYHNSYPLGFQWKRCSACRFLWMPDPANPSQSLGPHREDHVGETFEMTVCGYRADEH